MTIQKNFDSLLQLGIQSKILVKYPGLLLRKSRSVILNFKYLHEKIGLKKDIIRKRPQILAENPDAFAKKMRILKLEVFNLKRRDDFDIVSVSSFYGSSPATLMSKKKYCISKKIDYKNNISYLNLTWKKLTKFSGEILSDNKAKALGRALTAPIKRKYDIWMKINKIQAKEFFERKNRRIINRV